MRTGRVRCAPHEVGGLHTPEGLRLRIFVHEALRHGPKPLYAAIVELARREGLAGRLCRKLRRHLVTTLLVTGEVETVRAAAELVLG